MPQRCHTPLIGLFLAVCLFVMVGIGQEEPATGSLAIRAIQGTSDAMPIRFNDVEISLLDKDTVIQTIHTQLDEHGIVFLDDIPITADIQPVIRIEHAGVTYQEVGRVMGPNHPQQTIDVTCYEVTSEIPKWSIPMRQVMISHTATGIQITELFVINNPDDHTWLGTPDPQGQPITMTLDLPQTAENVKLGKGFHDWCCTSLDSNSLSNHLPMMPHITELDLSYSINTSDGSLDVQITSPSSVDQMIVMLPESMHAHSVDGLTIGGTRMIADTTVRYYTASELSQGQVVSLSLTGLPRIQTVAATPYQSSHSDNSSSMYINVLIGIVLLLAIVSWIYRMNFKLAKKEQ